MLDLQSHPHWPQVISVCQALNQHGFVAYLAGGCVRDLILKRPPNDFDVATNATPEQIEKIFPKCILVGKKFGVIVLPFDDFQIEVATFRKDGPYFDGRRPHTIEFSSAQEDALRRDFTINALFLDPLNGAILDFVEGEIDIGRKIIQTVGDPLARFTEDKLRIMRAIRFCAQLGFQIDPTTLLAIKNMAPQILTVSHERIRDEFLKLLRANGRCRGLALLHETGLRDFLLPEWKDLESDRQPVSPEGIAGLEALRFWFPNPREAFFTTLKNLENVQFDSPEIYFLFLNFAIFLRSGTASVLKRFKFSNQVQAELHFIASNESLFRSEDLPRTAKLLQIRLHSYGAKTFSFYRGFCHSNANPNLKKVTERLNFIESEVTRLCPSGKLPEPWMTGADLKRQNISPGPEMGSLLEEMYAQQIEMKFRSKEDLVQHYFK